MIHRSGIINGKRVYETPLTGRLPDTATELRFSISSHDCWRPGSYDSERAARYALRFYDEDLDALMAPLRPVPPPSEEEWDTYSLTMPAITFEMLQDLRKRVGDTKPWER